METIHGVRVEDPYRWLERDDDPEVRAWVGAMDRYSRAYLARLPGRRALARRLAALRYVDDQGRPVHKGGRLFYSKHPREKDKDIYCWREGETGPEHVLLDPNTMSKDGSVAVKGVFPNDQGTLAAYGLSRNNSDETVLHIMEVATGRVSKLDVIPGANYTRPSWTPDGKGFYYTRMPTDPKIPRTERVAHAAVYYHRVGTPPSKDELVFPPTGDPKVFLAAEVSRDGRWLFLYKMRGWSHVEVWYKDLRRGRRRPFKPLALPPKGTDAIYQVIAWKGWFYIHTNEGAPHYVLYRVRARRPGRRHWRILIPERKDAVLDSVAIRGDRLALRYLVNATTRLELRKLDGTDPKVLSFPVLGTASQLSGRPGDPVAYLSFQSFVFPHTIYRVDLASGKLTLFFQAHVPFDPTPYVVEQVWYPSKDGTKISMFLFHRKGLPKDGSAPTLLYGYGGFNVSLTPWFSATWASWVERGGLVAIPNLRGGGEYGQAWHRAGMLDNKQNVFDDFVWAARWLIDNGYTTPNRLAIRGGSNGGLLVGAAMVQAPQLFKAVVCHVPLLDMLRYHRFGLGKAWIPEYGDPDDPKQFRWLHAYSPYHHVRKGVAYPDLLMMSADSDDRVHPMHARKFVAAVRWATGDKSLVLLRVEHKAGHGGADLIRKWVEKTADEQAFLFDRLGVPLQ